MAIGKFLAYLKRKKPVGRRVWATPIICLPKEWRQLCECADEMAKYAKGIMCHQAWPR